MKWRAKSAALRALELSPGADRLHYLIKRYVTRSLPRSTGQIEKDAALYRRHLETFRSRAIELDKGLLLSFGAGWDLLENLIFYGAGVNRQLVLDVKPLARVDLVNDLVERLHQEPLEGVAPRPFKPLLRDLRSGLLNFYGIDYRAPADARAVPLPNGVVDMIATTNTLEHIAKDRIAEIMRECRRLISPRGIVSMLVDYSDDFSHSDPSITCYNFLRFESEKWRRHNVDRNFQNRLRHSDYIHLFQSAGFEILEQDVVRPPDWAGLLALQPVAPEFSMYEAADLTVVAGRFVLAPA